jgi:hypothetical protein
MFEESQATAVVKSEDACTVFALDRPQWDQVVERFPALKEKIHQNMVAVRAKRAGPAAPTEGQA